jgi:hypothetical protein
MLLHPKTFPSGAPRIRRTQTHHTRYEEFDHRIDQQREGYLTGVDNNSIISERVGEQSANNERQPETNE